MKMNYLWTVAIVAFIGMIPVLTAATEQDPFYEIVDTWPDHFKGNFCLTAPMDLYGWKIKLQFKEAVTSLQISKVVLLGTNPFNTQWRMKDEGHNTGWKEGERRCFSFIGIRSGLTTGVKGKPMFIALPNATNCPPQIQGQRFNLSIDNHWRNGISGQFCLRAPRDFNDWSIRVEFSLRGVRNLQVPEADTVTNVYKKMTWLLTPRTFNQQLNEGQILCLDFTAETRKWIKPCIRAFFTEADGSTPIEVSLPPTTITDLPPTTTALPLTTTAFTQSTTDLEVTSEQPTQTPNPTQPPTTTVPMSTPEYGGLYTELQLWDEGVNGELCMYHAIPITCGWEAEIVFEPAIDSIEIWRANVTGMSPYGADGNVVHLSNSSWNFELTENPVCLDFNAFKSYIEAPRSVTGQFTRICNNDNGVDEWVEIPGGTGLTPAPPTESPLPDTTSFA